MHVCIISKTTTMWCEHYYIILKREIHIFFRKRGEKVIKNMGKRSLSNKMLIHLNIIIKKRENGHKKCERGEIWAIKSKINFNSPKFHHPSEF